MTPASSPLRLLHEVLPMRPKVDAWDVFRGIAGKTAFFFERAELGAPEAESAAGTFRAAESILAFDPHEVLRAHGGRVTIERADGKREEVGGDPFSVLSSRIARHAHAPIPGLDGFQGGALGYFSYDSVRTLEPVLTSQPGNLQLYADQADGVAYDAELAIFRQYLVFDHVRIRVVALASDSSGLESLKRAYSAVKPRSAGRKPAVRARAKVAEVPVARMTSMLGKARFLKSVRSLKEHIRAGDIFQAVLSDKFTVPFRGDPGKLFEALSGLSPAPYRFYGSFGPRKLLGASPEMLLRVREGVLESHPIAGTRPRGATPALERKMENQLLKSTKEKAEHLMLVDLARNDVGRVSEPGSVRVAEYMQVRKFASVMHLVSRVNGKLLNGVSPVQALAACFPAGTLSGAPKIRAMQLISGLEPQPRGFYGGAVVAACLTGNLDSCIAIRSIEVDTDKGQAVVQAGAGIVADSRPENEYEEVMHKSRMARRALALVGVKGGGRS